ncbi:hypothetical protein N7522_009764 [Penicillium canescens]|nr:hypothetical protein N7522_009764 [Penicillium canescens]
MSASLPGSRDLPPSQYDLSTYWGRVRHAADIADPRTLFVSGAGLESAKSLIASYKQNRIPVMTPELWSAKKVVDATLHPDTGTPVLLPFRMTRDIRYPPLANRKPISQRRNQQRKRKQIHPLSTSQIAQSYLMAVSASCSTALGLKALVPRLKSISPNTRLILSRLVPFAAVASASALNVFLMRGEEIRQGIDVYPVLSAEERAKRELIEDAEPVQSLGKSKKAATLAVGETAISRVLNATPIMVLPPLILVKLEKTQWLRARPRMIMPVNLALILGTSLFALPLALAAFPSRQAISASSLEEEFRGRGGDQGMVEFNRGM